MLVDEGAGRLDADERVLRDQSQAQPGSDPVARGAPAGEPLEDAGAFAGGNQAAFHARGGQGYTFLADKVLELDGLNPQVAARMAKAFNPWKRFDAERQALIRAELERIAAKPGLSKDVTEIITRALDG